MHEMLLYNAARYFESEGFATLRLSMYGGGEKSRNISRSDVMTHATDIDVAVKFVKQAGAPWVAVVGHSYSGMAVVYSKDQAFDAAVLWDPTHTDGYNDPKAAANLKNDFIFVDALQAYVSGVGPGYVYAKTVFDNTYPNSHEAASRFMLSSCIINASWSSDQQRYGKHYADTIDAKTEHIIIANSSHPFTEDGAAERLFAATASYCKRLRSE